VLRRLLRGAADGQTPTANIINENAIPTNACGIRGPAASLSGNTFDDNLLSGNTADTCTGC
jgi:hypothetical protein